MTAAVKSPGTGALAATRPPEWARIAVSFATIANLFVLAFVSLPVIGFALMAFHGFSPSNPTPLLGKVMFGLVILAAAALPVASIYFSWRWLRRGSLALALAAGLTVPILGAALVAAFAPGSAPPAGTATEGLAP